MKRLGNMTPEEIDALTREELLARIRELEKLGFVVEDTTMESAIRDTTAEEVAYYDSRFRAGLMEGLDKGRDEERENGIHVLIDVLKLMGSNRTQVAHMLMLQYSLTEHEALEKVKK